MGKVDLKFLTFFLVMMGVLVEESFVSARTVETITTNDSGNIPARARRAGGTLKTPIKTDSEISEKTNNQTEVLIDSSLNHNTEDDDYSDESEEKDCPRKYYWHIRGQRCVPRSCVGGNSKRDVDTGECLKNPHVPYQFYRSGGNIGYRHYVYRSPIVKHRPQGRGFRG